MDWLRQHMRDHLSNVRQFPTSKSVVDNEPGRMLPSPTGERALNLVHAAADLLRNTEDQSAELKTYARALAERALGELQAAQNRIQALEMDCEKLNGLVAQAKDRVLAAIKVQEVAQARIADLEAQLTAANRRAEDAENTLTLVEDTIRSEIVQPMRSRTKTSVAA
jgi:hypothetical protein